MLIYESCQDDLKNKIELLREEMIIIGLRKGLSSEHTLKVSQKLDNYLAIYITMDN